MISFIVIMVWLWFSSRRVVYAESILLSNWDELSEEVQNRLKKNKTNHMSAAIAAILMCGVEAYMLYSAAVQQAAGG